GCPAPGGIPEGARGPSLPTIIQTLYAALSTLSRRVPGPLDGLSDLELVLLDLLAQRVPVDLQILGGPGKVSLMALEDAGDELLLELAFGLGEQDPLFDHLRDE